MIFFPYFSQIPIENFVFYKNKPEPTKEEAPASLIFNHVFIHLLLDFHRRDNLSILSHRNLRKLPDWA